MTHGQFFIALCALWVGSELLIGTIRHSRGGASRRDRGSLAVLWIAITGAAFAGSALRHVKATRIDGPWHHWAGIALIGAGIAVRWSAILTLRRQFTVDVSIQEDHQLIDRGVYAVIRHPAYTGAIISFAGLGLVFDNWLSFAAVLIIAVAALSYRIAVEERALIEHFGDRYRAYARRTKRLIPGIY